MSRWITKIGIICLLAGCGERTFTVDEFVEHVKSEKNKYKLSTESEILNYTVQFKPVEYVVLSEAGEEALTIDLFNAQKEELKDYYYFDFVLSGKSSNDLLNEFQLKDQELMHYLSFDAKNEFSLVSKTDTIFPELCHYEKSLFGEFRFSLLYQKPQENTDLTFIFNDLLTGYGPVKFHYGKEILNHSPQLNLN